MTNIEIHTTDRGDPLRFAVRLSEDGDETHHEITMSQADFGALARGTATAEQCIEAAFRFLLDREPKEAILKRFDIAVIGRYFPEFSREFPRYLRAG